MKMKKNGQNVAVVALFALVLIPACEQKPKGHYPEKNIFVFIFSSQGGGTDRWARHLSALMEKELGVNIVCNNLPGANGGTGAMRVWNAPHDGYTILGASETSMFFGVNDVAPTAEQWEFFIAAGSPGVLAVHSDSPYKTIQDLVQAAKNNPNKIKVSNSGQGKLWHIKVMQFEKGSAVEFQHVPYNGSAPAITALLSKEVDAVSCSTEEIVEYVRGCMIRPLIITDTAGTEFENFGFVKPAAEIYPDTKYGYENLFQWLGFLIPRDVPDEVLEVFGRAFDKAVNHAKTDELIEGQKARKIGLRGREAKEMALRMQSVASWMSKELGIAKKDPVELGISRP